MLSKSIPSLILVIILLVLIKFGYQKNHRNLNTSSDISINIGLIKSTALSSLVIEKPVTIENYFQFLDSIVQKYDSLTSYNLNEHLLVRANPWIIENLKNTDYYILKAKDSFVYNQKK